MKKLILSLLAVTMVLITTNTLAASYTDLRPIKQFKKDFKQVVLYYKESGMHTRKGFKRLMPIFNRINADYENYMKARGPEEREVCRILWQNSCYFLQEWIEIKWEQEADNLMDEWLLKITEFEKRIDECDPAFYIRR